MLIVTPTFILPVKEEEKRGISGCTLIRVKECYFGEM
jgi:hypothetical protein